MSFQKLYELNVVDKTEKKNGLSYLSWAFAWAEFKKVYPGATYEIVKNNGIPYFADGSGAMVYTNVTADNLTYEMWLPIMDNRNKALQIGAFTMFDVNKTIMRCLVKNLAMFGLGLYIYAGEDLPESEAVEPKETKTPIAKGQPISVASEPMFNPIEEVKKEEPLASKSVIETLLKIVVQRAKNVDDFKKWVYGQYKVNDLLELTQNQAADILALLSVKPTITNKL